jgi:hypothetical protein
MRAELIIDAEGPNPEYNPPSLASDPSAYHAYSVPHTIVVKAGSITPDDPLAWVLCFPKSQHYVDQRSRKPRRVDAPGELVAIPADEQCRAAFEKNLPSWCKSQKLTIDQGREKIRELISRARAAHAIAAEPTSPGPPPAGTSPDAATLPAASIPHDLEDTPV